VALISQIALYNIPCCQTAVGAQLSSNAVEATEVHTPTHRTVDEDAFFGSEDVAPDESSNEVFDKL